MRLGIWSVSFLTGGRASLAWWDGLAIMYRVIAIVCAGLALAGCESNADWMKTPDWMKTDWSKASLKWGPPLQTVHVESEPPEADAKATNGTSCKTPCALALPGDAANTITFTLAGYQTDTEKLDLVAMGDGTSQLRPNPLLVELTPLPPPPKPMKKKVVRKKKTAARPAPKPAAMSPQQPQAPSPWPTASTR